MVKDEVKEWGKVKGFDLDNDVDDDDYDGGGAGKVKGAYTCCGVGKIDG